jgi:hypothetical protein
MCVVRDVHIMGLFVDPWGAKSMTVDMFSDKNAMGCMEDAFGKLPGGS